MVYAGSLLVFSIDAVAGASMVCGLSLLVPVNDALPGILSGHFPHLPIMSLCCHPTARSRSAKVSMDVILPYCQLPGLLVCLSHVVSGIQPVRFNQLQLQRRIAQTAPRKWRLRIMLKRKLEPS